MSNSVMSFRGSELERLALCPGSKKAASNIKGKETAEATSGTLIHAALAECVTLDSVLSKEKMAERVDLFIMDNGWHAKEFTRHASVLRWFSGIVQSTIQARGGALELVHEEHFAIDEIDYEVTGHPDLIARCHDGVDVFEYKTGEGEQETAEAHLQGQLYVCFAAMQFPPVKVAQPYNVRLHVIAAGNEKGENHTFTDYDERAIKACNAKIRDIIHKALAENAPRTPSAKACRYCKAAGTSNCPESTGALDKFAANVVKMDDPTAVFGALAPEARAAVLDRIALVKPIIDKILAAAKDGLNTDPAFIPGYRIGEPSKRKSVEDARKAFEVVRGAGVSADEFAGACKVSLTDLKALYSSAVRGEYIKRNEKPPAKAGLDVQLVEKLTQSGAIVEKEIAGSLEKV